MYRTRGITKKYQKDVDMPLSSIHKESPRKPKITNLQDLKISNEGHVRLQIKNLKRQMLKKKRGKC